jgi:hypothetical protein
MTQIHGQLVSQRPCSLCWQLHASCATAVGLLLQVLPSADAVLLQVAET